MLARLLVRLVLLSSGQGLFLKAPCAPKLNDFEFPIIKTMKLLVETRSGT